MFETPSENLSFILPQSTCPPPSIGRRNGPLSSWPAQEPCYAAPKSPNPRNATRALNPPTTHSKRKPSSISNQSSTSSNQKSAPRRNKNDWKHFLNHHQISSLSAIWKVPESIKIILIRNTFFNQSIQPCHFPQIEGFWRHLAETFLFFYPIQLLPRYCPGATFWLCSRPPQKAFLLFYPNQHCLPRKPPPQYWTTERPPELLACPGDPGCLAKSQECYMGTQSPYYST